ncbi:MAG: PAS domain-containing protein, partial [Synergistaceae bacterium]|nr:PAS domain-containing protein [Synergistaceae bacterium]
MKKKRILNTNRVSFRVSMVVGLILIICVFIEGILSLAVYRNDSIEAQKERVKSIAVSVASAFRHPDRLREAFDTKTETDYWKEMKSYLDEVKTSAGVSYLYVLDSRYDNSVYYIMEGAVPGEEVPGIGDADTLENFAKEKLFETLKTGGTTTGLYDSEEYGGLFVYCYSAIMGPDGKPAGIAGADIHIDYVAAASTRFALKTILVSMAFSALLALFVLWYIRRSVSAPLDNAARIQKTHKQTEVFLDAMPLSGCLIDKDMKIFRCNEGSLRLFGLKDSQEFIDHFYEYSPEYQPDGQLSTEAAAKYIKKAFKEGQCVFEWLHLRKDGTPLPAETTLVRIAYDDDYAVAGYVRDLREHKQMMKEIERGANLLHAVNQVANILLQSESGEFESNLHRCMGMVGGAVSADRVCMWKNHTKEGKLYCNLVYDWPGGTGSLINSDVAVNVSYDENTPGWEEILSQGNCINTSISRLSPSEQAQLKAHGVKSLFV